MPRFLKLPLFIFTFLQISIYAADLEHIITLKNQTIIVQNFGSHIDKVINATGEEKYIGFVQKKINYRKVPAYFEEEISREIANFLQKNLMQPPDNDFPLYVRVDDIHISESYDGISEKAMAKVEFTFFTRKNDEYYQIFSTTANKERTSAAGITKRQPALIAEAIALCFENLYYRNLHGKLKYSKVAKQEIFNKPELESEANEILLNTDRSKAGIYQTFYDFQQNTPDTITNFEVNYNIKSLDNDSLIESAKIYNPEDYQDFDNVWGFNDGTNIFIRVKNKFIFLDKDDKGYYINIKVYDKAQMYYAGLLGGLIGSSITAASTPKTKVRLNILSGSFEYSQIDGHTNSFQDNNPETKIILFASMYNKADLFVTVNDSIHCEMAKGTWYEYIIPRHLVKEPIKVVVKSANNGLIKVTQILPKIFRSTIYLCIDHKKKVPSVDKIILNNKQSYLNLMTNSNRTFAIQDE